VPASNRRPNGSGPATQAPSSNGEAARLAVSFSADAELRERTGAARRERSGSDAPGLGPPRRKPRREPVTASRGNALKTRGPRPRAMRSSPTALSWLWGRGPGCIFSFRSTQDYIAPLQAAKTVAKAKRVSTTGRKRFMALLLR